ncbi:MAG: WD40/YVTN/BNR-like repeat-containing protein, partial [Terriglobales bacterium]
MPARPFRLAFIIILLGLGLAALGQVNPNLYAGLRWRLIGPFRAGRVAAVTGAVGEPGVFYIGLPLGGAWKTTSAGMTWFPIMDSVPGVDSVGAIETAPSNPNIVYAGTGENIGGNPGHGMFKSTDAGKTWTQAGLAQIWYINAILVDPRNPGIVLAAAAGDPRAAGPDRGVYRSTDGGQSWKQVLHPDDSTAISDIAWAADDPSVVFATSISDVRPAPRAAGAGPGRG